MAGKIFDYSKWDRIELSDDESDLHPNIDKESWFRLKHRTRLEREEKEDQEVKEAEKLNKEDQARLNIINARLNGLQSGEAEDAEFEDTEALEGEAAELNGRINERLKRIADIKERRKWNIDNICQVKDEKSQVSKGQASSLKAKDFAPTGQTEAVLGERKASENPPPAPQTSEKASIESASSLPPAPARAPSSSTTSSAPKSSGPSRSESPSRERFAVVAYNDFVLLHEKTLEDYSEIHDLEATKEFLFKKCDILLHEHAQSYMLLSSLEDEMNGKLERMKLVSRQSQILSHIHELGVSMNRDPRDVILPFFKRIEEKEYLTAFLSAVQDFITKIKKRAIEKRREMDAERGEVQMGPGGLDPYEVLESLPTILRDAFESQDIERLQEVLGSMNPSEAKYHMKRCVDSGLWVPNDSSVFEE